MGKSQILVGRTPHSRRARRRGLGPLRDLVVQPTTLLKYRRALREFFQWRRAHFGSLPIVAAQLDLQVSAYADDLWHAGDAKVQLGYTLSALQHHLPYLRG
eukprot:6466744-Amphidinium_carterae.1